MGIPLFFLVNSLPNKPLVYDTLLKGQEKRLYGKRYTENFQKKTRRHDKEQEKLLPDSLNPITFKNRSRRNTNRQG